MSTFLLIHGASSSPEYWGAVAERLEAAGHRAIAPRLPNDRDDAVLEDYAAAATDALGELPADLVVVGQSMGAFTAGIVADRLAPREIVLVAPLIPAPGESVGAWFEATGQPAAQAALAAELGFPPGTDAREVMLHDVDPDRVEELMAAGEPPQGEAVFGDPFPLDAWPAIPTRVVAALRDRLIPYDLQCRLSRERLGVTPTTIATGHLPGFSDPAALTAALVG